jgi:hypothetical protein
MRRLTPLAICALALAAAGCASHRAVQQTVGLIPAREREADLRDDRIRMLGVDRAPAVPPEEPLYQVPFLAFGAGIDFLFVNPTSRLYAHFSGDTPQRAANDMLDENSADKRRYGVLRLAEEEYARQGVSEHDFWASLAEHDPDYTVRAAGIRALNWSRDNQHNLVFINGLKDEQPLVRLEAAKALANIPDARAVDPLMERMQQDVSRDVRIAAADALRCYKTQEVAHALINVLGDDDFAVAWQARQSLRLMTAYDFHYDERAWLVYLTENELR